MNVEVKKAQFYRKYLVKIKTETLLVKTALQTGGFKNIFERKFKGIKNPP